MQRAIAGVLLLGVAAAWGDATLTLPTFIASHMVLQRAPLQARLWGWTKPGKNVTATLDQDLTITTTAGASGEWELEFAPQVAGSGHTIEIHDGTSSITLADVAFGDVWLCSGQSNMEFSVNTAFNASAELADSASYPDLRLATVKKAVAPTPLPDIGSKSNYSWARSGPHSLSLTRRALKPASHSASRSHRSAQFLLRCTVQTSLQPLCRLRQTSSPLMI